MLLAFSLWGDSHADAILPAVAAAAARAGPRGTVRGGEAFPPLLGAPHPSPMPRLQRRGGGAGEAGRKSPRSSLESALGEICRRLDLWIRASRAVVLLDTCAHSRSDDNHGVFLRGSIGRSVSFGRREEGRHRRSIPENRLAGARNTRAPCLAENADGVDSDVGTYLNRKRFCAECLHEPAAALRCERPLSAHRLGAGAEPARCAQWRPPLSRRTST